MKSCNKITPTTAREFVAADEELSGVAAGVEGAAAGENLLRLLQAAGEMGALSRMSRFIALRFLQFGPKDNQEESKPFHYKRVLAVSTKAGPGKRKPGTSKERTHRSCNSGDAREAAFLVQGTAQPLGCYTQLPFTAPTSCQSINLRFSMYRSRCTSPVKGPITRLIYSRIKDNAPRQRPGAEGLASAAFKA